MSRLVGLPWCALLLSEAFDAVPSGSLCGLRSRNTLDEHWHRDDLLVMGGYDCQAIQTDPAVSSLLQVSSHVHHFAKNQSLVLQPHLKEGVSVALAAAAHSVRNFFGPRFPLVAVLGLVGTPVIIAALFVLFLAKAPPERNSNAGRGCPCCPWPPYERDVSRKPMCYDKAKTNSDSRWKSSAQHVPLSPRVATPSVVDWSQEVPAYVEPARQPVPKELLEELCVNYEKEGVMFSMYGRRLRPQAQNEELPILKGQQRFLDVLVSEALEGDRKGIVIQTIQRPEVIITQLDTSRAFEAPLDGSQRCVTLWNPWDWRGPREQFHVVVEPSSGQIFSVIPVINDIRQPPWYRVLIGGPTFDFYNDNNKMDAKMQIKTKAGDDCIECVFTVDYMVDASLIMASSIAILKLQDIRDPRYPRR